MQTLPGRVRLLDSHTVNQIAAGEVVERPASVVKELVENALDAGARMIDVALVDCGKTLIRVSDDGCGMGPEDLELAIERHATSKIASADDLTAVRTLGFRGEALPSIAAVSRLTLSSSPFDGLRRVIRVEGGVPFESEAGSGPRGTTVTVEDLFFNTPARLKFLKSDATELAACVECVSRYVLAHPNVRFSLSHNGQELVGSDGSGDLLSAIAAVWGRDLARGLAEVAADTADFRVSGYVGPPHLTKPTRAFQYVALNGRPVRSRTLQAAVDQAFRSLTPERRHPIVALRIQVDPSLVDVNVSPTKSEVKFQRESAGFDALFYALRSGLMEHGMIPDASGIAAANQAIAVAGGLSVRGSEPWRVSDAISQAAIHAQSPLGSLGAPSLSGPIQVPETRLESRRFPFAYLLDDLKVLGQAIGTFIVAETRHGIAVIDQHVAHERILYEHLCGLKGESAIEVQPLLTPETLHVDLRTAVLLHRSLDKLKAIGFELEPFGGESFLVRTAPAVIRGRSPMATLKDIVDELVESAGPHSPSPTREQVWITSACRMAVKAGDHLAVADMERLIVDLSTTENPYLCPHGRPIAILLSTDDLMRKFKRA